MRTLRRAATRVRSSLVRRLSDLLGPNIYVESRARIRYAPEHLRRRLLEEREVRRIRRSVVSALPATDITVICNTYRRPEKVRRAVLSVLAQETTRSWTMVVIDDAGGLDPSVLPDDDRVRLITLQQNTGGPAIPRNVGLRLARSPLAAILDDDNEWLPDHLELLADAMEGNRSVFAYSQMAVTLGKDATGDVVGQPFDRRLLRFRNYVDSNCMMVRRGRGARFSTLPRYPLTRYWTAHGEDWELAFRRSRWRRLVAYVPQVTVRYEADGSSYYRGTRDASA